MNIINHQAQRKGEDRHGKTGEGNQVKMRNSWNQWEGGEREQLIGADQKETEKCSQFTLKTEPNP